MPLVDPLTYGVVRDSFPSETKTFANVWQNPDGSEAEISLTLTCRALDNADGFVVLDQAAAMARAYVSENGSIPQTVDLGGRPIAMSTELCNSVANVLVAQAGSERYDFEALCRYAVLLENQWPAVMIWVGTLKKRGKDSGKASKTV